MVSIQMAIDDLKGKVEQRFLNNPEETKKEIAIAIRAARTEISIEAAAAIAERAYDQTVQNVRDALLFSKPYGIFSGEPQIDILIKWGSPEDSDCERAELLGGLDEDGVAYILARGGYDERKAAREEYERCFPATMQS